ncbi:MAG: alpha/beta hydrolase [Rhodothermales bacterium]|nr:alpha/beta hydrolase [Rhodothermales bacterium]
MRIRSFVCAMVLALLIGLPRVSQAQAEFQSGHFLTSDDVRLHYLDEGAGPTLVFVPGWTMPAWIWEHQIRHFSRNHRVIAFDPRGQGSSDKPAFGYDHGRRARDIGELIAHLDTDPVVLVGWSLGVLEVIKYLEEDGTRAVRGVVLVDWEMHYDNPEAFAGRYVSLQTEREDWTRRFVKAIYRSEQSAAYLERVLRAALDTPTNAAAIMIGNIILQGDTDLRPFMDVLDRPVLFVYSSSEWSRTAAADVRAGWSRFQVEVIDETSHTLFVDKSDEFNRVLEEFLVTLPD